MTARRPLLLSLVAAATVAATAVSAHAAVMRPGAGWAAFAQAPGSAPPKAARLSSLARAATPAGAFGAGARSVTRVPVAMPQTVGLSQATRTLYVTADTGVVSVIGADRCNARRGSGCAAPVATMTFGPGGSGDVTVDERSGTGFVSNPDQGTVSLFDVTRCNAHRTSGCAGAHPSLTTGGAPIGLAVNERTRTLYVGNAGAFLSVVDLRACNRSQTAGCAAAPAQVATDPGPVWPTVDEATNTVYAPEQGEDDQFPPTNTVAVVDGAGCNASVISGCGQTPAHATVGGAPAVAAVDPVTRTLYVENANDLNVSVLDAATCNGRDASGCGRLTTVRVGNEPNSNLVIDQSSRTLFVVNTNSDTMSAVDVRDCNARDTSGCGRPDRTVQTGNEPFWVELDRVTGTLFVPEHMDGDVAAFDVRTCNARRRWGCRQEAPTAAIPDGVWNVAADPATHTLWAGGGETGKLSLLDTRHCRAGHVSGCGQAPFEAQLGAPDGSQLNDFVLDRATHTLYVINTQAAALYVLDAQTCNVARHDGCTPRATVTTPPGPFAVALDPRTRVLDIANLSDEGSLSLLDAAHCNATDTSGCAGELETVALGGTPFAVAVDEDTDSAYVALGSGIAVLHAGERVGTIPASASTGGLAVDRATHTLYAANWAFGENRGSVSVIDTRVCSGLDQSGCARAWPTVQTGRGPFQLALDPATHRVFSGNFSDATVSVIDGASCNALSRRGCARVPPRVPIGNIPYGLELAADDRTLYTANAPDREVSVIDADAPCRAPVRCQP